MGIAPRLWLALLKGIKAQIKHNLALLKEIKVYIKPSLAVINRI